jgi:hypothetical protein
LPVVVNLFPATANREFSKNRYVAVVSQVQIPTKATKIWYFPVKFPLCRESAIRLVRFTLRRQPSYRLEFTTLSDLAKISF